MRLANYFSQCARAQLQDVKYLNNNSSVHCFRKLILLLHLWPSVTWGNKLLTSQSPSWTLASVSYSRSQRRRTPASSPSCHLCPLRSGCTWPQHTSQSASCCSSLRGSARTNGTIRIPVTQTRMKWKTSSRYSTASGSLLAHSCSKVFVAFKKKIYFSRS